MLWYIAFVSLFNLALGYALAVYLGPPIRPYQLDKDSLPTWPEPALTTTVPYQDAIAQTAAARPADDEPSDGLLSTTPAVDDTPDLPVATAQPVEPPAIDPLTQLLTRECGERRLAELSAGGANCGWACAVLMEVNWAGQADSDTHDRLLCGVAGTVRQLVDDEATVARHSDRRFLLVLPGSDAEQATKHVEQVRQRVEATKYAADGVQWPTTVTCALADVGCNTAVDQLLDLLDEALAEARRYGGNRTFMHDGLSPTPVVPLELGLAVQQCAV